MTERDLTRWPGDFGNWDRWDNDRGTLNLITPAVVLRAAATIRTGQVFGLGNVLQPDEIEEGAEYLYEHTMIMAGDYPYGPPGEGVQAAGDRICVATHGMTNTHIDALCHAGHHGLSFNGHPFHEVVSMEGKGKKMTILDNPALVTRGVLVDVPRMRNLEYLRPGDPVLPEELERGAADIEPGDALVIRTGRFRAPLVRPDSEEATDDHGNWSDLHHECMDFIAEKDVGVLATDGPGDNFPSTSPDCSVPIHILSEVYLGMPLMHHLWLDELADACAAQSRNKFFFAVGPLQIQGGTGSCATPIAVL